MMIVKSLPDFCSGCRVVQLSNDPSSSTWLPPWLPAPTPGAQRQGRGDRSPPGRQQPRAARVGHRALHMHSYKRAPLPPSNSTPPPSPPLGLTHKQTPPARPSAAPATPPRRGIRAAALCAARLPRLPARAVPWGSAGCTSAGCRGSGAATTGGRSAHRPQTPPDRHFCGTRCCPAQEQRKGKGKGAKRVPWGALTHPPAPRPAPLPAPAHFKLGLPSTASHSTHHCLGGASVPLPQPPGRRPVALLPVSSCLHDDDAAARAGEGRKRVCAQPLCPSAAVPPPPAVLPGAGACRSGVCMLFQGLCRRTPTRQHANKVGGSG